MMGTSGGNSWRDDRGWSSSGGGSDWTNELSGCKDDLIKDGANGRAVHMSNVRQHATQSIRQRIASNSSRAMQIDNDEKEESEAKVSKSLLQIRTQRIMGALAARKANSSRRTQAFHGRGRKMGKRVFHAQMCCTRLVELRELSTTCLQGMR